MKIFNFKRYIKHLQLVENGVLNYGGGIFNLRRKVIEARAGTKNQKLNSLFLDVESYLTGLIDVTEAEEYDNLQYMKK